MPFSGKIFFMFYYGKFFKTDLKFFIYFEKLLLENIYMNTETLILKSISITFTVINI